MSESEAKKVVAAPNLRGVALDHMTVASAERALRNKTANLSVTGAAARLTNVTAPVAQETQQPQASSTTEVPAAVPSRKQK